MTARVATLESCRSLLKRRTNVVSSQESRRLHKSWGRKFPKPVEPCLGAGVNLALLVCGLSGSPLLTDACKPGQGSWAVNCYVPLRAGHNAVTGCAKQISRRWHRCPSDRLRYRPAVCPGDTGPHCWQARAKRTERRQKRCKSHLAVLVTQPAGRPIGPQRPTNIHEHRFQHALSSRRTGVQILSCVPCTSDP